MGKPLGILVAVALAFALAACSDDPVITTVPTGGSATASTGSAAFPVTVTGTGGDVTIDARPERIVSLSPTATEDLFAIGAGDQVVAVDEQSNYPAEAPTTELSGFEPNVEAIGATSRTWSCSRPGPRVRVLARGPGDHGVAAGRGAEPRRRVRADRAARRGDRSRGRGGGARRQMRSDIQGLVDERTRPPGRASPTSSTTPTTPPRRRRSSASCSGCSASRTSPTRWAREAAGTRSCRPSTSSSPTPT